MLQRDAIADCGMQTDESIEGLKLDAKDIADRIYPDLTEQNLQQQLDEVFEMVRLVELQHEARVLRYQAASFEIEE